MTKNKKSEHQKELENLSLPVSEVPVLEIGAHAPVFIDDYATLPKRLEDMTLRELLEVAEATMLLGKKYENLTAIEGERFYRLKEKYNNLYVRTCNELGVRLENL